MIAVLNHLYDTGIVIATPVLTRAAGTTTGRRAHSTAPTARSRLLFPRGTLLPPPYAMSSTSYAMYSTHIGARY